MENLQGRLEELKERIGSLKEKRVKLFLAGGHVFNCVEVQGVNGSIAVFINKEVGSLNDNKPQNHAIYVRLEQIAAIEELSASEEKGSE